MRGGHRGGPINEFSTGPTIPLKPSHLACRTLAKKTPAAILFYASEVGRPPVFRRVKIENLPWKKKGLRAPSQV